MTSLATKIGTSALLLSALALGACSSKPSKEECQQTDFYQMGIKDGEKGKTADRYAELSQDCQAQGTTLDSSKYNNGRQIGLAKYCTESRAKSDAKDMKTDSICLKENMPPYMAEYQKETGEMKSMKEKQLAKIKDSDAKTQKKEQGLQGEINKLNQQQQSTTGH